MIPYPIVIVVTLFYAAVKLNKIISVTIRLLLSNPLHRLSISFSIPIFKKELFMKSIILFLPVLFSFALISCSMHNDEKDLRAFIDKHIKIIEPKLKALNLASWNASATGEKKFYDEQAAVELEVRTIYSNKKEYEQLKKWKDSGNIKDSLLQRQLIIIYNNYLKIRMILL